MIEMGICVEPSALGGCRIIDAAWEIAPSGKERLKRPLMHEDMPEGVVEALCAAWVAVRRDGNGHWHDVHTLELDVSIAETCVMVFIRTVKDLKRVKVSVREKMR